MTIFEVLDVGCGNEKTARGTVNIDSFRRGQNFQIGDQLKGKYVNPNFIPNFIVADACYLPFKDNSFRTVFSSHTIEHVIDPELMFRELCRVAARKIIVRCPHRKGSGARRPFHLNYFDESWFSLASTKQGYSSAQKIKLLDPYPISSKIPIPEKFQAVLPWRALKHVERKYFQQILKVPFELESQTLKKK